MRRKAEDVAKKWRRWARFGAVVRHRRQAKDIGLRELDRKVNMDQTYLSKAERGEFAPPGEDIVKALAHELEVNPDYLLARSGKVATDVKNVIRSSAEAWAEHVRVGRPLTIAQVRYLTQVSRWLQAGERGVVLERKVLKGLESL